MASEPKRRKISRRPQSNLLGVQGNDYEVHLLTLFSLKALFSDEIVNFQIENNNGEYGKFDDIILTLTPVKGEEIKIAFQLKHVMTPKQITRKQLENESTMNNNYGIPKYYNSYQEIKIDDKNKCHYVLFTNNQISLNSFNSQDSKYSIEQVTSNIFFNIFNSGKVHKFRSNNNVNQNEFLNQFYIFSDQSNEKKIENEIEEIFIQNFGSNDTANLLKLFRDLHKEIFTNKILNKATLICHLINSTILRHHSINLEQVQTSQSLCKYFYNAVKLFDATHISCENLDFLKQNLKLIDNVSKEDLFRWAQDHKFVDKKLDCKNFQIDSHCRILYHIDNQPIVLNYSRDSAKVINCVIKLCRKKYSQIKFILASSEIDFDLYEKKKELNSLNLFENLSSLEAKDEKVCQQLINHFEVAVNGRKLKELSDFISFNDQIAKNITPDIIVKSLKTGVIKFGEESDDELPPYYIPRQISGDLLSFKDVITDKETLFIISCDNRHLNELHNQFKNKRTISINFHKIIQKNQINTNIILTKDVENITEDKLHEKIESKFQKVRYLDVIVDEIESRSAFIGFRNRHYTKSSKKMEDVEQDEVIKYFKRSIEVITATPGMGKTTFLKSIAKSCPSDYFCIPISLKEYSNFFKQKCSLIELLKEHFHKQKIPDNFQCHIIEYIFQNFQIIFLFDGFDEIDPQCHDNFIKCVNEVKNRKQKVWISTRPTFSELLRNKFKVNDLEIVELNEKTQKEYIRNRLSESKENSKVDEIINKIYENVIFERHQTLLGTPLLLHMVTEMVINNEEDLLNINNITDLFKYFFKGKFIHHMNKHGVSTFVEEYFNAKLDSYEIPALKLCLETNLFNKLNLYTNIEQVVNLRKSGDSLGVIVNVSGEIDNPNFSFFHNAYAEYFAGKWLTANYTRIPIENRSFLLEDKYENLKFIFDIFMAEGCPAHIAVLCKDEKRLAKCTEDEIVKTDKLNRSVWHIICQYGDKFPSTGISYSKRLYKIDEYTCEFQPKNLHQNLYEYLEKANNKSLLLERDFLFDKTALDCATERFSINIVDHICEMFKTPDNDFNELTCLSDNKYLIIYYSLKFGYVNLLQLNFIRNVIKTQTITYYKYDDYSYFKKRVNIVYLAAKYGQLQVLKHLDTFLNLFKTFDDLIFRVAAQNGHLHILKELLARNANVNATDIDGRTPLGWAAENGHLDVVKELIKRKANVNARNNYGKTPLFWAAKNGHIDIVKELIAHNADVNAADEDRFTSLWAAAYQGHLDIVKVLIANNADINATDEDKKTPLSVAAERGHVDIVKEIKQHLQNI